MKNIKLIVALVMILSVMMAVCACGGNEHQHDYSADWNSDAKNHWHVCNGEGCNEIAGSTAHTFGEGVVTTPATEDAEGVLTKKCTVCGYEKTEAIAKLPASHNHELTKVDGFAPTCVDKGIEDYYTCSCGKKFSDEQGENEILYPVVIDETGHSEVEFGEYVAPDCDTSGLEKGEKCSVCGVVVTEQKMISPLGHTWNDGAVTTQPTCYSEGIKTFECTVCGDSKTESVPVNADAHAWNGGVVTTAPTCAKEGEKTYTCTEVLCGAKKTETVEIDPEAHQWNEGSVTTAPTCTEKGVKSFECTHNSEHKKTEAVEINPDAHEWNNGEITIPATCTAEGEKTYTCTHNSEHTKIETVAIDENAHSANNTWENDAENHWQICENGCTTLLNKTAHTPDREEATETDPIKCTVCEYVIAPVKDHQHNFSVAQYDATHHWNKCSGCEEIDEKIEHFGGAATCVAAAVCDTCKQSYGEKNAENHTGLVVQEYKAPTCTEIGYTEGKSCTVCGTVFSTSEEIPATGHTEEAVHGYAATCTAKGLFDGKRCVVCKAVTVEQVEIEIAPHAWGDPVITIDGNVGTSTYTCEKCGAVEQKFGPIENITEKHVCDHLVSGVETEFGSWTACSVCGAKSWAQTALSAYKGSGTTHTGQAVYLPNEGGNPTVAADMVKQSVTVSDVAVSYNLLNKDKSLPYLEFTYTITVEEAMTVNVYVNGRSTNTSSNVNEKVQINKFMKLFQGDTEIAIGDSAAFPAYREGCNYWNEQLVATLNLVEGTNTFTFRFLKDIKFNSVKAYGGYISYFRFAEESKALTGCENNIHDLKKVLEVAPTCLSNGVKAHYACADCGKIFDTENNLEIDAKYLVIPHWNHVFENVARLQADGTYAYQCTRGCGTTRAHVCTGGTHLIIAKEPNLVWYEEGDTFNPDRMELYLSTACAEGCSGNTVVAGHLKGYDALTYTYQNGDSFKAGDEYITINYTVEGETYSVQLPVTVTAVGKTITIDNTDVDSTADNYFTAVDNSTTHKQNLNRENDTGKVGQSAYGGSYANNFADGDVVTFTFTLGEAQENANIVLRAAQDRVNGAGGTPPYVSAVSVNDMITIKVDGVVVEFSDDVILKGSVTNLDQTANRWVWTNWMSLDLGTYSLDAGEHKVEIIYNNVLGGSVCCSDTVGAESCVQLDCLNVFLGE